MPTDKSFDSHTSFVAKNNDELLLQLSEITGYPGRVRFAREHWKELGEGSSRTIFQLSASLVLKVAHNIKGIEQNFAEAQLSHRADCTNNVLVADLEGLWIIVPYTEALTEEQFGDIIGIGFKPFVKAIYYKMNNEVHEGQPRDYDKIIEDPFFQCILSAVVNNDLQVGDVTKISSWGLDIVTGMPVLRDFGLTKEIWNDFYSDNDGASITTIS